MHTTATTTTTARASAQTRRRRRLLLATRYSLLATTFAATTPFALAAAAAGTPQSAIPNPQSPSAPPNIIYILVDDMGYADIGPFGAVKNRTPNLDRMAAEGMKLTSFYAAPLCTASRTQGMTGCYAKRVSMPNVLKPAASTGISSKEHTVAELLKKQGYTTMAVGKWHLGDQPQFLPLKHGFDYYFGLPYSNDMQGDHNPPLPLIRNNTPIEIITPEKQDYLEERYTNVAVKFIRDRAADSKNGKPFFLYLAHTAVHRPLHPGPNFQGKSANGPFGDWIEEVDWSTGRVLDTLRELGLADNTLVFFSSDNGPDLKVTVGSAKPLRGGKGGTFEGGMRESCIAWWPGKVPAGATIDTVTGSIDLLPTFVALAGGTVPNDNKIDGADISPILLGKTKESPRKAQFYFFGGALQAVRSGPWKLAIASQDEVRYGYEFVKDPNFVPHLYNLDTDIGETRDVAAANPDIVKQLLALVAGMDKDLGIKDKEKGPGVRPPGHVAKPTPLWHPGYAPPKEIIEEHYD